MNSSDYAAMPLKERISSYARAHGEAHLSQVFKAACNLGFLDRFKADLNSALTENRPIPGLENYALRSLESSERRQPEASLADG